MLKSSNISPLKEEIFGLKSKLASVSAERTLLQDALRKIQNRINHDVESSLSRQAQNYESRLTELHSVIAELKKQLEVQREKIIPEESTEDENENEEDILVEQEEDQEEEVQVEDEDDEENPEVEEEVEEEEEEEEQDIDGLPTSEETDVVSADSTSTSPSNSDLIDKDEEMMSTSKRVEKVGEDDGPQECQYQNDNDKDVEEETGSGKIKEETKRRISVSRSRRRLLQTSHQQNNTRNNKPTSGDETGRTDIKDKPLSVSKSLNLRDFEMSSWREVNPKGKPTKILSSSGNSSSTKKPLPLSESEEGRNIYHQQQKQQKQHQHHHQQQQQQQHREELEMIREKPRLSPDSVFQFAALRDEVAHIREEHYAIRETLFKREGELDRTRDALENIAQERDFLRKKVSELEYLLKQSPKKFPQFTPISSSDTNMTTSTPSSKEEFLMCKVAERVKLSQCRVTSPNPSSPGCPVSKGNLNHKTKSHNHNNSPNSPSTHNTNTNSTSNNNNHNNNNNNNSSNCHHHHHHHQSIHLNMNSVVQFQQQQHLHQQHQQQMLPHKMGGKSHSSHNKSFITGQELVAIGNSCSSRIVEHLVQPLQDESTVTEMQQAFALTPSDSGSGSIAEDKMREFEIETERLNSRLEHLRSQNDVLTLNLEDAKSHSDRLTVLLGKYESNNVGHQIALSFSDQVIEAYDVLVALLESELGLLLANCRAAGIGAVTSTKNGNGSQTMEDDIDVASLLQRANENRMTAEIAARNLIIRMVDSPGSENNNGMMLHLPIPHPAGNANLPPWEDASSCSQTLSSASSLGDNSNHSQHSHGGMGSGGSENGNQAQNHHHQHHRHGNEEQRVRDLIIQLKTDREAVRNTLMELENWSMEPMSPMQPTLNPCDILEARKLDLETAVLMQELMAMREDRAELRAQLFLLEKEKTSLEFKLDGYAAQQDAYKARINHLKAEIADMQENSTTTTTTISPPLEITDTADRDTDTQNLNENENENATDGNANNNKNGKNLMRDEKEMVLKKRIQELATSLEKIIHSTNVREQQSSETENELKKANNILLETLEGVKRKYQSRVKKMEEQIIAIMERHSMQMKLYKDRVQLLEIDLMERRQHL